MFPRDFLLFFAATGIALLVLITFFIVGFEVAGATDRFIEDTGHTIYEYRN